jgi:hypothetical protein
MLKVKFSCRITVHGSPNSNYHILQHSTLELKYGEFQYALESSSLRGNF